MAPLKIRVKPNADRIFDSNENDRRHSIVGSAKAESDPEGIASALADSN